jgi:hypothetical protein
MFPEAVNQHQQYALTTNMGRLFKFELLHLPQMS